MIIGSKREEEKEKQNQNNPTYEPMAIFANL
jgi:hypothetical protein